MCVCVCLSLMFQSHCLMKLSLFIAILLSTWIFQAEIMAENLIFSQNFVTFHL